MKHVKVLSSAAPAPARSETSFVQFKNIFGALPLTNDQRLWVLSEVDNALQK